MNEFTYTNIFETKGIEYLVIITFLLLIIPFWRFLNKPVQVKAHAKALRGVLTENIINIMPGLLYNKNHTWTHLEKSGFAKVGLDDLLVHITGDVKLNNLKIAGEKVNKGDLIAQIIQEEKHLDILSPVSGEVKSVNTLLNDNPEALNNDPCGKGWLLKIKPEKWHEETKSCYLAEDALEWARNELVRLKDFVTTSMANQSYEPSMVVLQEGGELSDNPLSEMSDKVWKDFQTKFLDQTG